MTRNKFVISPRLSGPRGPLPQLLPDYPGHPIGQSAKFCLKCGTEQRRKFSISGPMEEKWCEELPTKQPRITGRPFWKYLFYLSFFVSPPNPSDPNKWYRVREDAICPTCGERHNEKDYRRQFGRLKRWELSLRSFYSSSIDFMDMH